jgi:hypothetical protein
MKVPLSQFVPESTLDVGRLSERPVVLESHVRHWDGLPADLLDGGFTVLLGDKREVGHFVCIFKSKGDQVLYFDSFGKDCPTWIKKLSDVPVRSNKVNYQDDDRSVCGKHTSLRLSFTGDSHSRYFKRMKKWVEATGKSPDYIVDAIYETVDNGI